MRARRGWLRGPSGIAGSALLGASVAVAACGSKETIPPPPHTTTTTTVTVGGGGDDPSGSGGAGGASGTGGAASVGCGDGVVVFPEQCDGANLDGATCKGVGYDDGALACTKSCGFDVTKCTMNERCTDGFDNDKDGHVDCADSDCAQACATSCTPASLLVIAPDFLVVTGDTTGHADTIGASCSSLSGSASGPEIVYQAQVNVTGVLDLALVSEANLGVSVRTTCASQAAEIGCSDRTSQPQAAERLKLPVTKGETIFIAVQGYSKADAGFYTLEIHSRAVACGDGFTDPPEACDDGAVVPGDGCSAQCAVEPTEAEPNAATASANTYASPWVGAISPAGDVDVIAVAVTSSPATLTATIGDFDGGCQIGALDSYLEILDQNGTTLLATDDDGGVGTCSSVQASGLTAGTYYVRVSASPQAVSPTFAYKLTAKSASDICGDGVPTGAEQCDDGNLAAGDGCGATCLLELTESEPNGSAAMAGAYKAKWRAQIAPVGDADYVAINVPKAGATLQAEVVDDGTGDCAKLAIMSRVDILGSDGVTVLASGSGIAGNYCAYAMAKALPAGKYFVRVRASILAQPGVSDTFGYGLDLTVE